MELPAIQLKPKVDLTLVDHRPLRDEPNDGNVVSGMIRSNLINFAVRRLAANHPEPLYSG